MKKGKFLMQFSKLIFIFLLVCSPTFIYAELLSVQVKKTFLRAKPSFLSKVIVKMSYAQQVQSQRVKGSWNLVKSIPNGTLGWVHSSALSEKTIVLRSSGKLEDSSVSQSEVLMAGKGFNKEVENEYKQQVQLNYKLVDTIEKSQSISKSQLIRFAKNGKLSI